MPVPHEDSSWRGRFEPKGGDVPSTSAIAVGAARGLDFRKDILCGGVYLRDPFTRLPVLMGCMVLQLRTAVLGIVFAFGSACEPGPDR